MAKSKKDGAPAKIAATVKKTKEAVDVCLVGKKYLEYGPHVRGTGNRPARSWNASELNLPK